jgi:tetratricopeptide (TPR) repeat protein
MKKLCVLLFVIFLASCSTAPKRPAAVYNIQSMTDNLIGMANKEADQANYEQALMYLDSAWILAVQTDRPSLRVRVNMGMADVNYLLGKTAEAENIWRRTEREADFNDEPMLASACRVFRARSTLMSGTGKPDEVLAIVQKELNILKPDKLFYATAWTVKGLCEKEMGLHIDAEKSIMNALSIHEKANYLEQAAYDWYLIASVRSVAGNYQGAIDALNRAIAFDRRAENTFALAMDWTATGEVYRKMGNENRAAMSFSRAAEILRAVDKEAEAFEIEQRITPGTDRESRRNARQQQRQQQAAE